MPERIKLESFHRRCLRKMMKIDNQSEAPVLEVFEVVEIPLIVLQSKTCCTFFYQIISYILLLASMCGRFCCFASSNDTFISALVSVLNEAIAACLTRSQIDPWESHRTVKRMYKWSNVAKRTEAVSNLCLQPSTPFIK